LFRNSFRFTPIALTAGNIGHLPPAYGWHGSSAGFWRRLLFVVRMLLMFGGRLAIMLVLFIGLGTVYNETVGDGALPRINPVPASAVKLRQSALVNTAAPLPNTASPEARWAAMASSRKLLGIVSPDIAQWLERLHAEGRIAYEAPPDTLLVYDRPVDTSLLGAYRHFNGKLYLGQDFWGISDGEKVCVLVHEYRHSRQNLPKQIAIQLARLLVGKASEYASPIEDEAFVYEHRAYRALGLPDNLIQPYLQARSLD
jgi:hypothetical protein